MDETLIIEKLGPIGKLEIKPRPLTIIIGEQASGKSLVAQVLYFFRGLESHLGRIYSPELVEQKRWHSRAISQMLNGLRAVPFNHFANGKAVMAYKNGSPGIDWKITVQEKRRFPALSEFLIHDMDLWAENWSKDTEALGETRRFHQIFIPTERSMYTRLYGSEPGVLFGPHQPEPLRQFAALVGEVRRIQCAQLDEALSERLIATALSEKEARRDKKGRDDAVDVIFECEGRALGGFASGFASLGTVSPWKWNVFGREGWKKLPIEATSSGQMEAWPFFAIARTLGVVWKVLDFYFEEPETHLHPRAQVEVMKVIAYLVNHGHRFVVTTHSPYLLYVINNMLQRFMSLKGKIPEGEERWLDPEKVVAYRLKQKPDEPPEEILDRKDTGLIDASELERVADELGGEFDELLYGME